MTVREDDVAFVAGLREKLRLVKELGEMQARAERAEVALREMREARDRYRAAAVRIYDGIELYELGLEDIHTILIKAFDPAELGEESKP